MKKNLLDLKTLFFSLHDPESITSKYLKITFWITVFVWWIAPVSLNAQLSITKTAPAYASPGELITYTITYANVGSTLLHNVVIEDQLPLSDGEYAGSFPVGDLNTTTGVITWTKDQIPALAELNAGTGVIYIYGYAGQKYNDALHSPDGYYLSSSTVTIQDQAFIYCDEYPTPVASAITPTVLTQICTASLSDASGIVKSATGTEFFYRVAITNTGNIYNKWNLTAAELPTSDETLLLSFEDVDGNPRTDTPWIEPGATYVFIFKLVVPPGTSPHNTNRSAITATPVACGTSVTQEFDTEICTGGPHCTGYYLLSTYKIDYPDPVQSGEVLNYEIVIYNANPEGTAPLTNVTLTETFPSQVSFLNASPAPTTGNNTWFFPSIPVGTTIINVSVLVNNNVPNGTILQNNINLSNAGIIYASYVENTLVKSAPDVFVYKSVNVTSGEPGDIVTYTLEYGNHGNYEAHNVLISDNYDESYLNQINLNGGIASGGQITWNIPGTMLPGTTSTITYTMQIRDDVTFPPGTTYINNDVFITSAVPDVVDLNDNSDHASVIVSRLPDLKVEKTPNPDPAQIGNNIVYTITASNIGVVTHTGEYEVIDYIPAGLTYVSSSPSGLYDSGTHTVSWNPTADLTVGGTATFTLELSGITCEMATDGLSNKATVFSSGWTDAYLVNNEITIVTTVEDSNPPIVSLTDGEETVECLADAVPPSVIPTAADACDGTIDGVLDSVVDTPNPLTCEGTRVYTYSYTDSSENVSYWHYTYTIARTTPPYEDGETVSNTLTVNCIENAVEPTILPVIKDACGTILSPSAPLVSDSYDGCEGTKVYTYTYMGCEGLQYVWTYTYTIDMTTALVVPANESSTVECLASATDPGVPATIQDVCNRDVVPELVGYVDTPDPITCEGTRVWTYRYTACDPTITADWTYTYTIDMPELAAIEPTTDTVNCYGDIELPIPPMVYDACGNEVLPGEPVEGEVPECEGEVTYTWTYTDCAGSSQDYVHTVTIDMPELAAIEPTTDTVNCYGDIELPIPPMVYDACGNEVLPGEPVEGEVPECEGEVTYTWTYTDCAGSSQDYVHTVTIDMPELAAIEPTTDTVNCYGDIELPIPPMVYDACGNEVLPGEPVEGEVPECEGEVTYTWTYTDCAGSSQDYVHTVTIDMPELAAIEPTTDTVNCYGDIELPIPPMVYDACGNEVLPGEPVEGEVPECEGEVTYTWTYTDCAGSSQDYVHTVTIDMPELAAIEPTTDTVNCYGDIELPIPPMVYDACGNEVLPGEPVEGEVPECEGEVTYTWTYTDCAGSSQDYVHTVTIDMPELAAIEPTTDTVNCYGDIELPIPPMVYDACGNEVLPGEPVEGEVPECEGEVTYTWTYTDCAGSSQDYVHTVTIDMPELAAIEPTTDTVNCYGDIELPIPPMVYDACGNEVLSGEPVEGEVPECEGEVTYTWTYTDCAGSSQDYVHTVTIDMPELAAIEPTTDTVNCYGDIELPIPPMVYDACGNEVLPGEPVEGEVPECEGEVTYTWTYTDCAGSSQDYVHTVTIDMPELAAIEPTTDTVNCYGDIELPIPPMVYDACGNEVLPGEPVEGEVPECEGEVTYTWTYTDCAGSSQDYVHTVTIDMPELAAIEPTTDTVNCYGDIELPIPPMVYDACGNEVLPGEPVEGEVPECEGEVTYTWTYTDCAGSSQDYVHTVTIDMPELAAIEPTTDTVNCYGDIELPIPPMVYDACGNEVLPGEPVEGEVPECEGEVTYTWTYTDCAGSSQDYVHTVTIDMPELAAIEPTTDTVNCYGDIELPIPPMVYDACGNEVLSGEPVEGEVPECEGEVTYTWTYTDCAGSSQDYVHTVTIDMPELAAIEPTTDTVNCYGDIELPIPPMVYDACGNEVLPGEPVEGEVPECEGEVTYTWTYTDCAGSSQDYVHTVTIDMGDFSMPENQGSFVTSIDQIVIPEPPVVYDACGNEIIPFKPIMSEMPDCAGQVSYTYVYMDCTETSHEWVYTYTFDFRPDTPGGSVTQEFCVTGEATLADLVVVLEGQNTVNYYLSEEDFAEGNVLPLSTVLTDGMVVYASQVKPDGCESATLLEIHIVLYNAPDTPEASETQEFCSDDELTLTDLDVSVSEGNILIWYDAEGVELSSTTALENNITYYVSQATPSGCESEGQTAITVVLGSIPDAPSGKAEQNFCASDYPTVGDLVVTGNMEVFGINWYNSEGQLLDSEQALVDNTHYFATQVSTVSPYCESTGKLDVLVHVTSVTVPSGSAQQAFCVGDEATVSDLVVSLDQADNLIWYDAATGGNVVQSTTLLQEGTYYAEAVSDGECVSLSRFAVQVSLNDDCDSDGVLDVEEFDGDTDGDGTVDYMDNNDDGDEYLTIDEDNNGDGNWFNDDCDEDGIVDYLDPDPCDMIPNAFSPGNDGWNDKWVIPALQRYPDFTIDVYNRWGSLVYKYKNEGRTQPIWWDGVATVGSHSEYLPTGTYFYVIDFNDGQRKPISNWLYIQNNN